MTLAADNNGYREQLRGATGASHVRLDARFAQGLRNERHYRVYLLGMQAFIANAERGLAAATPGATWRPWCEPARTPWLDDDLAALGLASLPAGPALVIDGDADAAGLLYVIEGAALGATQLVGDARSLGHHVGTGATFLHRHGGLGAGKRWREFVRCLEHADFGLDAGGERALLDGAARAFASAEHEFHRAEQACDALATGACDDVVGDALREATEA